MHKSAIIKVTPEIMQEYTTTKMEVVNVLTCSDLKEEVFVLDEISN